MGRIFQGLVAFAAVLALTAMVSAQEQKPLVNADVVTMVKSGLPERTIIVSVQSNPSDFDVSPEGLIALHNAGVSQKVMDAMIAAKKRAATLAARRGSGSSGSGTRPPMMDRSTYTPRGFPLVAVLEGEKRVPVPLERTELAQTKTKPSSLGSLAKDKALDEAVKMGSKAARDAAGNILGGTAGGVVRDVGGRAVDDESKTVTYVWMVPGATSGVVVSSPTPLLEVSLNNAVALRQEEYAPVLVKLTPTTKDNRVIGATEGKTGATKSTLVDWPVYSTFVEDRAAADVAVTGPGVWRVVVRTPLQAGEYAVVLRPIEKNKKFAGSEVARNQGVGIAFNSVWSFTVK